MLILLLLFGKEREEREKAPLKSPNGRQQKMCHLSLFTLLNDHDRTKFSSVFPSIKSLRFCLYCSCFAMRWGKSLKSRTNNHAGSVHSNKSRHFRFIMCRKFPPNCCLLMRHTATTFMNEMKSVSLLKLPEFFQETSERSLLSDSRGWEGNAGERERISLRENVSQLRLMALSNPLDSNTRCCLPLSLHQHMCVDAR